MASQTLDDMIAALISMGFELQDAQDAVRYGKISTQEAVEWILAGKPGYIGNREQPATLKLCSESGHIPSLQPDAQTPFSSPFPIPNDTESRRVSEIAAQNTIAAEPSTSDNDMEQQVVSRLHLTEERVAHKKNFEEKERAEARRKAKLEKLQAKREHERILKEIAEDRKIKKMMRIHGPQIIETASASETTSTAAASSKPPSSSSEAIVNNQTVSSNNIVHEMCSLQICLPDGTRLRKYLDKSKTLGQLWIDVLEEIGDQAAGHCGFIQPFPRHEFTASEMNKTLDQLGLVPSGSLVLKKEEATPALEKVESAAEFEELEPVDQIVADIRKQWKEQEQQQNLAQQSGDTENQAEHHWGRGRTLDNSSTVEEKNDEDADEEEENEDHNDIHAWGRGRPLEGEEMEVEDEIDNNFGEVRNHYWADPQRFGGHGGGFGGRAAVMGLLGMQGGIVPGVFMGLGQRLIPHGVPGAENYFERPLGDLAAQAAQQRLAQPVEELPAAATSEPLFPLMEVSPLQDSCFTLVIERITDPINPLRTLGRMPSDLSQRIISHLLQSKLLDPKTLNLFVSCYLQRLILDTYTYATNELLFAVRLHQSLQTLSLHSCPLISDHGIKHIASLTNLKILNLGLCKQITNKSLQVIAGFNHLHTLSLEETSVTDSGLKQYFAIKPCLRHLNLNRTAVTNEIFFHLRNLEQLRSLYLEATKISSLQGLEKLQHLTTLNVASTHITTDALFHLANHPTLTQLSFTNTDNIDGDTALSYLAGLKLRSLSLPDRHSVTSAGLAYITGFHLHTLDLTNYILVGDEGMKHVSKITSLKGLMLSNTKVTDEGLLQLKPLVFLRILYLDRTTVSDVGIRVVKAFKQLSELSLSTTNVTSRFLKEGVLHFCQNITKLNLSRTHVGDNGVVKLKLPNLMLLNLDCTRVHAHVVDIIKANCPSLKYVTTANLMPVYEEEEEEEDA